MGCTQTVDAKTNTGTGSGTGEPIYWLNGDKVADNYSDFYDGSWDAQDTGDGRDETGVAKDAASIWVGCNANGTSPGSSNFLGHGSVRVGSMPSGTGFATPLVSGRSVGSGGSLPMFALSQVLTVTGAPPHTPAAPTFAQVGATSFRANWTAQDDNGSDITNYQIEYREQGEATATIPPYGPTILSAPFINQTPLSTY